MAINKTLGSGGDFTNVDDMWDYFNNNTPFSDDITVDLISSIDNTAFIFNNIDDVDLGGNTFTLTCSYNESNRADQTSWYEISNSYTDFGSYFSLGDGFKNGTWDISFIKATGWNRFFYINSQGVLTANISNCILYDLDEYAVSVTASTFNSAGSVVNISNCLCKDTGRGIAVALTTGKTGTVKIENCSFYNCSSDVVEIRGAGSSITADLKNVYSLGTNSTNDFDLEPGNVTADNCACSDTSLSGQAGTHYNNILWSDELLSVDETNENFLKPNNNGQLYDGGIAPTLVSVDVAGSTYGESGIYPIGGYMFGESESATGNGTKLIVKKRTMGFKIESTPYVPETLSNTDYDFSIYNITYSPEIESYTRKLSRGHYSRDVAVAGKRKFSCAFSVDLHSGIDSTTAPQYFQMLRACGLKQLTSGSGIKLITDASYDNIPATIEIAEKQEGINPYQLVLKAKGCMGNAMIVADKVGQPIRIEFYFSGALESVSTRSFDDVLVPTAFDTIQPLAFLGATVNFLATLQFIDKMKINLRNKVSLFTCANNDSGYDGSRIADRHPTLVLDPDMLITDDIDLYGTHIINNTSEFTFELGNLKITAPKAQIINSYRQSTKEGHVKNNLQIQLQGDLGNDELYLTQGEY